MGGSHEGINKVPGPCEVNIDWATPLATHTCRGERRDHGTFLAWSASPPFRPAKARAVPAYGTYEPHQILRV